MRSIILYQLRIKSLKNRQTNAYKAKLETRFKFAMTRKHVSPYREDDDQEKSKELVVSKKSVVSPSGSAANDALDVIPFCLLV